LGIFVRPQIWIGSSAGKIGVIRIINYPIFLELRTGETGIHWRDQRRDEYAQFEPLFVRVRKQKRHHSWHSRKIGQVIEEQID
jgi:hypothetical protein